MENILRQLGLNSHPEGHPGLAPLDLGAMDSGSLRGITGASGGCGYAAILAHEEALYGTVTVTELGSPAGRVCVECLIGKQKKPILFKVTEPSDLKERDDVVYWYSIQ
jgi:hypothetical protein